MNEYLSKTNLNRQGYDRSQNSLSGKWHDAFNDYLNDRQNSLKDDRHRFSPLNNHDRPEFTEETKFSKVPD